MVLILNDIGGMEVLLILAFILIFFGSKSIPGLARTFGKTIRQIKDASADLQTEIRKSSNEMKSELNLKEIIDDTARDVQRPLDQYAADIEDVMKRTPTSSVPKQKKSIDTPIVADSSDSPTSSDAPETPTPKKVKAQKIANPKSKGTQDSE